MKNFKIGDRVKIINDGAVYTTYNNWGFIKRPSNFAYGDTPKNGNIGIVIDKGKHCTDDKMLYVVDIKGWHYVMGESGIEKDIISWRGLFEK